MRQIGTSARYAVNFTGKRYAALQKTPFQTCYESAEKCWYNGITLMKWMELVIEVFHYKNCARLTFSFTGVFCYKTKTKINVYIAVDMSKQDFKKGQLFYSIMRQTTIWTVFIHIFIKLSICIL